MKTNIILGILLVLSIGFAGYQKYQSEKPTLVCFKSDIYPELITYQFRDKFRVVYSQNAEGFILTWNTTAEFKSISCPIPHGIYQDVTDELKNDGNYEIFQEEIKKLKESQNAKN